MEIKTLLHPNDWLGVPNKGHSNGYIGLPKDHPWFGKDYDTIHHENPDLSIHSGLTYARDHPPKQEPDGLWWIGFDTLHYSDTAITCSEKYCQNEVESLKQQALAAIGRI